MSLKGALNWNEYREKVYGAVRAGTWFDWPPLKPIPDLESYMPVFSPWAGFGDFPKDLPCSGHFLARSRQGCCNQSPWVTRLQANSLASSQESVKLTFSPQLRRLRDVDMMGLAPDHASRQFSKASLAIQLVAVMNFGACARSLAKDKLPVDHLGLPVVLNFEPTSAIRRTGARARPQRAPTPIERAAASMPCSSR